MSDLLCLLCTSLSKRKRGLQCSLVDVVLGLALARQPQVSSWAVTFSLLQLGPALGGDLILVFVNIYIHMYNTYTLKSANTHWGLYAQGRGHSGFILLGLYKLHRSGTNQTAFQIRLLSSLIKLG